MLSVSIVYGATKKTAYAPFMVTFCKKIRINVPAALNLFES